MNYTEQELKDMAVITIENYLNPLGIKCKYTKDWIIENCTLAIKVLINNSKSSIDITNGMQGVSSIAQSGQSISFNGENGLMVMTQDVKNLLPRPINFLAR